MEKQVNRIKTTNLTKNTNLVNFEQNSCIWVEWKEEECFQNFNKEICKKEICSKAKVQMGGHIRVYLKQICGNVRNWIELSQNMDY